MINTYKALRDLINDKLNSNTNGILFDTSLWNSKQVDYFIEEDNVDGVNVDQKRVIPAHMVEIVGNYINVPNTEVIDLSLALEFDIFLQDSANLAFPYQGEYASVGYHNTIDAINQMQKDLLAQRFTLGTGYLMFGGVDSNAVFEVTQTSFDVSYIKFKVKPTSQEQQILLTFDGYLTATNATRVTFNGEDIVLLLNNARTLTIPYTVNQEVEVTITNDGTNWTLTDGVNTDSEAYVFNVVSDKFYLGYDNGTLSGFNGELQYLIITEYTDQETPHISLSDFQSKKSFSNNGSYTFGATNEINNCLTWGSEGNVVFGFETLVPISDARYMNEPAPRQLFGLGINDLISKDVVFGNSTEYQISFDSGTTVYDVFPIDRQHTYATELGTAQYISDSYAKSIVEENMKDFTKSFFFKPDYELQKLMQHITSDTVSQNNIYQLIVQFPFHKETYDVVIDSGGTSTNINQLQTFTVTFKQKDDSIT